MSQTERQSYPFTLIVSGIAALTDRASDALFEAGCEDALVGMRDGVAFLDFDREASSFREAVLSAVADVEGARIGVRVVRVEPDELVTMSEIARRARRSRENIRQLATGLRGPGGFPAPVANLTRKSPIWKWTDVLHWLAEKKDDPSLVGSARRLLDDASSLRQAGAFVAAINAVLDLRRQAATGVEADELYRLFLGPNESAKPKRGKRLERT